MNFWFPLVAGAALATALVFGLVLGQNLGVGRSLVVGADVACQEIRFRLIECET